MKYFSNTTIKYFFLKDECAVKDVYEKTYRLLYHISYSYTLNNLDAEDVVSITYHKALFSSPKNIKQPNDLINYLCTICKNTAIDLLKKRNKEVDLDLDLNMIKSESSDTSLYKDIASILTKEQYDVVMYKDYFDLSYDEISKLMNKSNQRCRSLHSEALKILRQNKELLK